MNRKIFLPVMGVFLAACTQSPPSPDVIIVTVLVTATPEPAQLVDSYTRELQNSIQGCIQLRDAFDFTSEERIFGYEVGIKKVEECLLLVLEIETPEVCQECEDLDPMVRRFVDQTRYSLDLIGEGHQIEKEVFISEGIVTFWDADIIWEIIRITIDKIREAYNLSELN
jgi:hypothetical protein